MAESQHSCIGKEDVKTPMEKSLNDIQCNSRVIEGVITRYILNTTTLIDNKRLKRKSFGVKSKIKPNKTVLLVGETGTGKSTLINAMVNYMLGINFNDGVWCEIIETKGKQSSSKTTEVTVYDVFSDTSQINLTIIDTPGFGSTAGKKEDLKVAETLHELFRSKDGVSELDVVALVVTSSSTRLTDRQRYVFNEVISLFGNNVEKNIVVFVTRASRTPINAIETIRESQVPCAKDSSGDPLYFRFDNFHCENLAGRKKLDDEEDAWKIINKSMNDFVDYLNKSLSVSLKLTASVLERRKQLKAIISNLKDRIKLTELKKKELQQIRAALQKNNENKKDLNNFEYEVDEPYKEKIPIESQWWHVSKEATCCSFCEENCHYPGCWWVKDLSWCSVMSGGKCTVCTGKCYYTKHVKEGKMYVIKTRRVKKTMEDLKQKYESDSGEKNSLINKLENEMKELENDETSLVDEIFWSVTTLGEIALKSVDAFTLQHLDFIITKLKEKKKTEKVQTLETLKKKAEDENSQTIDECEFD